VVEQAGGFGHDRLDPLDPGTHVHAVTAEIEDVCPPPSELRLATIKVPATSSAY
jgi:hypothetical protein